MRLLDIQHTIEFAFTSLRFGFVVKCTQFEVLQRIIIFIEMCPVLSSFR